MGMTPWMSELIELEKRCYDIRSFQSMAVPGLLQTRECAEQVLGGCAWPSFPPEKIAELVGIRMDRQKLLAGDCRPVVTYVLDEAVLHRLDATSAAGSQAERLLEEGARGGITIAVLPFAVGLHPGFEGSFTLFQVVGEPLALYRESQGASEITRDPAEAARFSGAFERLHGLSLGSSESAGLIRSILL